MFWTFFLYILAFLLVFFILQNIVRSKSLTVTDAFAALAIVVTILLAQSGSGSNSLAKPSPTPKVALVSSTTISAEQKNSSSSVFNTVEVEPTKRSTPTQTSILKVTPSIEPQPIEPQLLDFSHPNIKIALYNEPKLGNEGKVLVKVLAAGAPTDKDIVIGYAVKDLAGYWSVQPKFIKSTKDGITEFVEKPGEYAVWLTSHSYPLPGNYGIEGRFEGQSVHIIPVAIQKGTVIDVTISLAVLEVGVLSSDGNARTFHSVIAYTQQNDVSGKKIPVGDAVASTQTDNRGIAILELPEDTYVLQLGNHYSDQKLIFDVTIKGDERKREVYTH